MFSCFGRITANIHHHEESLNAKVIFFSLEKTLTLCTLSCGILAVRSHFVIENQTLSKDVWCSVLSVRWLQVHNKTYTFAIVVIENNTLALSSFKTTPTEPMDGRIYEKNLIPTSIMNYSIIEFQQN